MINASIYLLAFIGFAVVGTIVGSLVSELIRAARQAGRVATVCARMDGKRHAPATWILKSFRREIFRSYSSLRIGIWEIPHNPSKPIRRSFRG